MAWALQQAAREKQRRWDAEEKKEKGEKREGTEESESEATLNARLAARGVDLSAAPKQAPRAYDGIRKDIAELGGGATFGDVMKLLRQGPKGERHAELLQRQRLRSGIAGGRARAMPGSLGRAGESMP